MQYAIMQWDELVTVVAPNHPWARRTSPITLEELAKTPLVTREQGSGTRDTLNTVMAPRLLAEPAVELTSNAAARVATIAGVAPAVLSYLAVKEAIDSRKLVLVPVQDLQIRRMLRAIWTGPQRLRGTAGKLLELAYATDTA